MCTVTFTLDDCVWMRSQHVLFTAVVCRARTRVTWSSVMGAPPPEFPGSAAPALGPLPDPAIRSRRAGSLAFAGAVVVAEAFVATAECAALAIFGDPPSADEAGAAALSVGLGATAGDVGVGTWATGALEGTCTTTWGAGFTKTIAAVIPKAPASTIMAIAM